MALGSRVPLARAIEVAKQLAEQLAPIVARAKVAGSVRRQQLLVSDIEFVIEPRSVDADLFGALTPDIEPIRRLAESWGRIAKGGQRMIQVKDVLGTALDCELYLVHPPAQWGPALAIRTGPAELSKLAVARLYRQGRHCVSLSIIETATSARIPCDTEEEFFRLAGLQCVPPRLRDTAAAKWRLEGAHD